MGRIINSPYWSAGQRAYATYGFAPSEVDVAIIGGGLYGLAVMHWLSKYAPGHYVLLEKSTLGARNSSRSIGTVNMVPDGSLHTHGLDVFLNRVNLARENKRLLNELMNELDIDCGFIQNGGIHIATNDDQVAQLEVIQRHLSENGFPCESLNTKDICTLTGAAHFFKGLYYPGDMVINPYALMMIMAEVCAQVDTNCIVQEFNTIGVEEQDNCVEIVSDAGHVVKAKKVVVCTNELIGHLENSMLPVMAERGFRRSQVVVTDRLPDIDEKMQLSCRSVTGKSAWTVHNKRLFHAIRQGPIEGSLDYYDYSEMDLKSSSMFVHKHFGHYLQNAKRAYLWTDYSVNMPDLLPVVEYKNQSDRIIVNAGYDYSFMDLFFVVGQRIAAAITEDSTIDLLGGKNVVESET